jgi:hypothetical protein
MRGLVNTCCDAFCVLEGLERLVQYELRYIMGSRWHGRDLLNTCYAEFSVAGMGGFRQHKLRYIFCAYGRWMGLVNTC